MNNNERKNINRARRPYIDGVMPGKTGRFNQGPRIDFSDVSSAKKRTHASQKPGVLNDFARKEGFHSTRQAPVMKSGPEAHAQEIANHANRQSGNEFFVDRKNTHPGDSKKRFGIFRRKKDKKPLTLKKKIIRGIAIFIVILGLVVGFLVYKGYITLNKVLRGGGNSAVLAGNVDPSKLNGEGDGRVNILLLGRGGEGHDGADLTDTIILASIDPIAKEASLLSIPRDLYVSVPQYGSMKINAAFAEGKQASLNQQSIIGRDQIINAENDGFKLLEETIENTMGVPIHYHIMVDFSGFEQAINNVGGIDFNAPSSVTEQMRIKGQNYYLNVQEGQQHMDGFKALAYARSRYTSPRGDFDRAERQRVIISALKDKILSAGTFSNPQKISNLLGTFGDHVQTNFNIQDLQRLGQLTKEIGGDKISSIGLADPPNNYVETANIGGLSVVIPTAGIGNFKDIQHYVRNQLKDSFIRNENASIVVLNGTTKAGMATEKGDELKSYGYNVVKVDNAPTKTYQSTVIVDLRGDSKKYTRNYLEKRFGVTAVNSIPDPAIVADESVDFVIILGSDQAN